MSFYVLAIPIVVSTECLWHIVHWTMSKIEWLVVNLLPKCVFIEAESKFVQLYITKRGALFLPHPYNPVKDK